MKKTFMVSKVFIILALIAAITPISEMDQSANAFSQQVIQHGAVGDDVIELQSRLQYLGFYNGKIDGVFGWGTYWALRNFQYEFGLDIDGLAGQKTKDKLVQASDYNEGFVKEQINKGNKFSHYGGTDLNKQKQPSSSGGGAAGQGGGTGTADQNGGSQGSAGQGTVSATNVPNGFSDNDIQIMANAVYGEARGEPYIGQVAVAAVIINRVGSASFPDTVSGVIFEPRAFTAVADGQIWLTPNETARQAVLDAINGWDPSGSALYYFNPDTATSPWIWTRPQIKKIGQHIFCK
ncbi:peptidoglycan lytic transglycosylase [Cytobacillus horneckiae]|uniref:Spore cortex-lytic enzyme n=1 Tax=Cytobacillus horneckiae TaxID=549687 RepID=A0A2N0ZCV1_9BACI|nr:spore cortex-lytic enzyme [Cytobacillus horneckiae]MBN6888399.1 spore cortex-lytic enzyme [Cytobacillus horneckiae]MCM3180126.1 spore cortex-lytic enzyme [Cytobacillus horneckiae]MEC1156561.1 spore cortex-lytic enzyme [Cytobacillus horneckiae]MED2938914.1 spore cortex-lytic enzyme [Cytobacillus horneckiae]PKG27340.1 spore cortex-lytic enzyme [Cytobacillus horneckiae]